MAGRLERRRTGSDEQGDAAVARDFAVRNLLHGLVDGVEEGLRFVGTGHSVEVRVWVDWTRETGVTW
jgi:hypothetical protein